MESLGTVNNGPVTPLLLLSRPSTVKLLLRGRCPPMAGPEPAPIAPTFATPAVSNERFRIPLPPLEFTLGRSNCFCSNVVESVGDVRSKVGVAPLTSMDVTAPLISRVIFSVTVLFKSTLKLPTVVVAKLLAVAEMLYVPGGKLLRRYSPLSFALVGYFTPVAGLSASTVAFGTAAPVLSKIVPTTSPLMAWAEIEP